MDNLVVSFVTFSSVQSKFKASYLVSRSASAEKLESAVIFTKILSVIRRAGVSCIYVVKWQSHKNIYCSKIL